MAEHLQVRATPVAAEVLERMDMITLEHKVVTEEMDYKTPLQALQHIMPVVVAG